MGAGAGAPKKKRYAVHAAQVCPAVVLPNMVKQRVSARSRLPIEFLSCLHRGGVQRKA